MRIFWEYRHTAGKGDLNKSRIFFYADIFYSFLWEDVKNTGRGGGRWGISFICCQAQLQLQLQLQLELRLALFPIAPATHLNCNPNLNLNHNLKPNLNLNLNLN